MFTNDLRRFTALQLDLLLAQEQFIVISHAMIFEYFAGSSSAVFKSSPCDGNGYHHDFIIACSVGNDCQLMFDILVHRATGYIRNNFPNNTKNQKSFSSR